MKLRFANPFEEALVSLKRELGFYDAKALTEEDTEKRKEQDSLKIKDAAASAASQDSDAKAKQNKLKVFKHDAEKYCQTVLDARVLTLHAAQSIPVQQLLTASELYKNLHASDGRCLCFYDVKSARMVAISDNVCFTRAEPVLDTEHFVHFLKPATELSTAGRDFLVVLGGRNISNEVAIRNRLRLVGWTYKVFYLHYDAKALEK